MAENPTAIDETLRDFAVEVGHPRKRREMAKRLASWGGTPDDVETIGSFFESTRPSRNVPMLVFQACQSEDSFHDALKTAKAHGPRSKAEPGEQLRRENMAWESSLDERADQSGCGGGRSRWSRTRSCNATPAAGGA